MIRGRVEEPLAVSGAVAISLRSGLPPPPSHSRRWRAKHTANGCGLAAFYSLMFRSPLFAARRLDSVLDARWTLVTEDLFSSFGES